MTDREMKRRALRCALRPVLQIVVASIGAYLAMLLSSRAAFLMILLLLIACVATSIYSDELKRLRTKAFTERIMRRSVSTT